MPPKAKVGPSGNNTTKQQPPAPPTPTSPPPFYLDVVYGPAADTLVRGPVGAARMVLGRMKNAATDLHVADETVSQKHAAIEWEWRPPSVGGGRYTITDLGSTNGTRLNGEEVVGNGPAHDLNEGDVLHLGKSTWAVVTLPTPMAPGKTLAEYIEIEFARLEAHAHKRTDVLVSFLKERVAAGVATLRRVGAETVAAKRAAGAKAAAGQKKK